MISGVATDLLVRVRSVPALASTTSFAIGGKASDPSLKEIPLPACRLIFLRDDVAEDPRTLGSGLGGGTVPGVQGLLFTFNALVIVPYDDDNDILNVQFPLLESVITTVKAQLSPSGHQWRYFGQKLAFVYPDRLGFTQSYTVTVFL